MGPKFLLIRIYSNNQTLI